MNSFNYLHIEFVFLVYKLREPYRREESKRRGCHQSHGRRKNWLQQV